MGYLTMSDSNCTTNHDIHQYLSPVVYILVLLLGLPTSIYSLHHAWQQVRVRNELGIYLLNLTVSDILNLCSLPFWLHYFFHHDNWLLGEWWCKICGLFLYENIYITIGFLCCISVDRYLAVVYPFRFQRFRSVKASVIVSACIWIKEIGVCTVVILQKEVTVDGENHKICFEHYPMTDMERLVNYYRFFVGFLFPLVIITFSYIRILKAVKKSTGTQHAQKLRIKYLVSSTIAIFLLCFSPYHIFLLIRTIFEKKDCVLIGTIFNYYHFSLLLTSLNCLADPVLYCFVSESIQKEMLRAKSQCGQLSCCCKKSKTVETTENNTPDINGSTALTALQRGTELG
ncbi:ovarian cancer G-protein coupled receptor 1 [Erpetoichthys calabaricus]|uniref:ovarian cancer G-protein coupled receptor 1 n=1 Tax=Erpetoichthys calabaricus TaxID=27687 RepID=UPI00109EFE84|nr:ovarian cancer G-protein coupled receptor 1 [Erpetoichthys calabaricus]